MKNMLKSSVNCLPFIISSQQSEAKSYHLSKEQRALNKLLVLTSAVSWFLIAGALTVRAETKVWVMPEEYAFVVASNSGYESYFDNKGGISKWKTIKLWGRCSKSYVDEGGYSYKWDYGNGYSDSGWEPITLENYMKLEQKLNTTYPNNNPVSGHGGSATKDPIAFYTARLFIYKGTVVSTTTVQVKAVDYSYVNDDYFDDGSRTRRLIIESIAKGRGLKWLYDRQSSEGNWSGYARQWGNYPMAGTSLALAAFMVYNHSIWDPGGTKDVFVDCVEKGKGYLLKHAYPYTNAAGATMVLFSTAPANSHTCYEHGIAMLALAASRNQINEDPDYKVKVGMNDVEMSYINVIRGAVRWTEYAQAENSALGVGGWAYWAPADRGGADISLDLSANQWPVLGLLAIEDIWKDFSGMKADPSVKNNLLKLIRRTQYQSSGIYRGGALYSKYHSTQTYFSDPATLINYDTDVNNNINYYYTTHRWLVGTNSFLQMCYYLSKDTSTAVTACQCNADGTSAHPCNSADSDFRLRSTSNNNMSLSQSCQRVYYAIKFIENNWLSPSQLTNPEWDGTGKISLYDMYGIMKSLRLYNVEREGIEDGKLGTVQWEDQFSNYLLASQQDDGHWIDTWSYNDCQLGTSWALLILSETIYQPKQLKTELLFDKKIRRAMLQDRSQRLRPS